MCNEDVLHEPPLRSLISVPSVTARYLTLGRRSRAVDADGSPHLGALLEKSFSPWRLESGDMMPTTGPTSIITTQ